MLIFGYRSSDSTKYGTNKSSGASVTSGKHLKNQQTYSAHESVSNNGKPPMHPNHHQNLYTNHKTTSSIPVHNSKNGLYNNSVCRNNPYAFSVNCYDDSGYLESRPLSSASFYGDGQRVSRGTKSDIGVPCRRQSACKIQSNKNQCPQYGLTHENRLPSVKSDFLLSYLNNNNHNEYNNRATNVMGAQRKERTTHNAHIVNNKIDSNEYSNIAAYHISGVSGHTTSDMFRTDAKYFSTSSSSNVESNERTRTSSTRKINEQQRNRIINFLNRSSTDSSNDMKSIFKDANAMSDVGVTHSTSNVVGPLLYVDPTSDTLPSINTTCSNSRDKQSHPFQAVSK